MSNAQTNKRVNRTRRQIRGRAKIAGTAARPRVTVFKSNAHVYVQAIDDVTGKTIAAVNDAKLKKAGTKTEHAAEAGKKLAGLLKEKGVSVVVFDKAGFKYHGRIKAVAEALRAGGITV
jgi:large subunit ribosomal protein L18